MIYRRINTHYRFLTSLALAILFSADNANARLGESGDEIAKRFGDQQRVHPQISNAKWALDELEGAWRIQPGPQDQIAELFDVLRSWSWERVEFRGYRRGDFTVLVMLLDDKSVFEHCLREATLFDQEMNDLLAAQSAGSKWQRSNNPEETNGAIQTWKIIDSATRKPLRFAVSNGGSSISFYSTGILQYCVEAAKRTIDEAEKKKRKAIDGF